MKRRSFLVGIVRLFGGGSPAIAAPSFPTEDDRLWGVYLAGHHGVKYFTPKELREVAYAALRCYSLKQRWYRMEFSLETRPEQIEFMAAEDNETLACEKLLGKLFA